MTSSVLEHGRRDVRAIRELVVTARSMWHTASTRDRNQTLASIALVLVIAMTIVASFV